MSEPARIRDEVHADLRAYATRVFAARPELASLMMSVAQYWADEADDAVHAYVVGSTREVPVWPHVCASPEDGVEGIAGELCEYCCDAFQWMPFDDNGSAIVGFASYCHENGSQDEPSDENYLPYAIVRRDLSIEVIGHVMRGFDETLHVVDDGDTRPYAFDDRGQQLFELACASPAEDGPRRVLADYLLEREDPRGEYMSLALASALDDDARDRRDQLLAKHVTSWTYPVSLVMLPPPMSRFERGLLAHAEVYARNAEAVAAIERSPVWRSVESVRILPDSFDIVDPEMIALRRLGPIGAQGLEALAGHTWNIEELGVRLDEADDWNRLLALATLPRLRELTIAGRHLPSPYRPAFGPEDGLVTAPWFAQLTKLTVLGPATDLESLIPWLASSGDRCRFAIAEQGHHGGPVGWELAWDRPKRVIEVRMPGFSASGRRDRLRALLDQGPDGTVELIGGGCWQPTEADVELLAASGRSVTIRARG